MEIKLEDIVNAVNFIDTMVSRGAVKGEEIHAVGVFRSRLVDIIQYHQPQEEASIEEASTTEASE